MESSIKTYGAKNNLENISKVPVTEARTVFDALFAKNISLRNLSQTESPVTHNRNTRTNKNKLRELSSNGATLFDDTLNVRINSTFDDLRAGPIYNPVTFAKQVSEIFSDSSYDPSRSVLKVTKKPPKKKNLKSKTNTRSTTRNVKSKVESKGKVQKHKHNARKKIVSSLITSIRNNSIKGEEKNKKSDIALRKSSRKKGNNLQEALPNDLNQPVDYSLVIENVDLLKKQQSLELSKLLKEESVKSNYKRDMSNLSTYKLQRPSIGLTNNSNLKPENEYEHMFNNSFQHFMQAESTPKYAKSSTPMMPKLAVVKLYNSKLDNVSPITSRSRAKNVYNSSMSLFSDVNSNVEGSKSKRITRSAQKNNSISIIELPSCSVIIDEITQNVSKNSKMFNEISLPRQINSNIIENTPDDSLKNFKRKRKIQVLDSSTENDETNFAIKKSLPKIPRRGTVNKINQTKLRRKTSLPKKSRKASLRKTTKGSNFTTQKCSKELIGLNSVQVNLVEWENFSSKHSVIIVSDTSSSDDSLTEFPDKVSENKNEIKISPKTNEISLVKSKSRLSAIKDDEGLYKSDLNISDNVSMYLKPGKQYRRSLSILKQIKESPINLPSEKDNLPIKGRKWRTSVFNILVQQDKQASVEPKRSILSNNGAICKKPNYRPSIRVVRLSNKCKRSTVNTKKSGYVSTVTDDTVLESFSKLSLVVTAEREETAKEIILKRCNQTEPLLFDECYPLRTLQKCRKIGEGVYGEVFMYKNAQGKCVVMKIIPIEGEQWVNGEHQKKYEEIISEVIISTELSNLRTNDNCKTDGFAEVLKVCLVQGKYPQHLIDLWELYDEDRGSENDSPVLFTDEQLYIVLELANGGQDLEAYHFNNAELSYSLFLQIACSMAVAEAALQFEHRDLHWGNVLISPTDDPMATYRINGREFEIPTKGVKLTIIDFTLSRMISDDCCIFNDLAMDPDLFTASGDYQFEIYRLMRKRNNDDWQKFEPYTNVLWLDYILEKMIGQLRYVRINSKTHKTHIRKLSQIRKKILSYNSVMEFFNSDVFSNVFL